MRINGRAWWQRLKHLVRTGEWRVLRDDAVWINAQLRDSGAVTLGAGGHVLRGPIGVPVSGHLAGQGLLRTVLDGTGMKPAPGSDECRLVNVPEPRTCGCGKSHLRDESCPNERPGWLPERLEAIARDLDRGETRHLTWVDADHLLQAATRIRKLQAETDAGVQDSDGVRCRVVRRSFGGFGVFLEPAEGGVEWDVGTAANVGLRVRLPPPSSRHGRTPEDEP